MTDLTTGTEFGPSSWIDVTQEKIDAFAEATGDHQWIHVEPERAAAGPFGTTIAHGYLTLSLLPAMSYEVVPRQGGGMAVNYGLNKVRFPAPVPSGSRVRGTFRVEGVDEADWDLQATMTAIDNLMEDAATAEISRSQVWQWVRTGHFEAAQVRREAAEVEAGEAARELFLELALAPELVEFLTLPAYTFLE